MITRHHHEVCWYAARAVVGLLLLVSASSSAGGTAPPTGRHPHDTIPEYFGPQTCVGCHPGAALDVFGSVHYQETGPTPNVPNISGFAGKLQLGFNTYCGTPLSARQYACATCHIHYGLVPTDTPTPEQLGNIDCMMCHQELYKRRAAPPYETVEFTDYLGESHTWELPVEDEAGSFSFEPDEASMEISILEAARTVHLPTRAACLRCHAYAAGSNCGKRGDLSSVHADPPLSIDLHMSSLGANLRCQDCHEFADHHVLGRGLDLRPNDRPERLLCSDCHTTTPHDEGELEVSIYDRHAARVACQTCHIPTYAKSMTTEVVRHWDTPVWAAGLLGGQGGYKPEETRAGNLIPTYRWFDGTSNVYILGQVPPLNDDGEHEFGAPNGAPTLTAARIHPMKEHWSTSARHDPTGQMIPHATFKYFVTGDFTQAVEDGMAWAGLSGSWTLVDVHTYQTINHGVEDHESALACGACHASIPEGGPLRMDLQGELGYGLKGPATQVCSQCHEYESSDGFPATHDKHVASRQFDCRWCHTFSRPERGLTMPTTDFPGDLNCDGAVNLRDINPFVLALASESSYYAAYSCNRHNADINSDGQVGLTDINPFVLLLAGP